ncbi:hypothetical protein LINGRAHAP2_LOCUS19531, partial [Linum grandiflorum]
ILEEVNGNQGSLKLGPLTKVSSSSKTKKKERSWEAPLAYPCFLLLNKTSCFYFVFVCGLIWGWLCRPSLLCFFCVFSMCVEALIKMTLSLNALDR